MVIVLRGSQLDTGGRNRPHGSRQGNRWQQLFKPDFGNAFNLLQGRADLLVAVVSKTAFECL